MTGTQYTPLSLFVVSNNASRHSSDLSFYKPVNIRMTFAQRNNKIKMKTGIHSIFYGFKFISIHVVTYLHVTIS